jgi:hypothetical protein
MLPPSDPQQKSGGKLSEQPGQHLQSATIHIRESCVKRSSRNSDFFCGKNLPFCYKKKVQSNTIKGTFLKISKKFATFQGSYEIAKI